MVTALIVVMVLLVYTWILYPGIMLLLPRKRNREQGLPDLGCDAPLIAIVFSAHNEEKVIGARLANLTNLNYPNSRLAIYVGIDGCTDRTESIARDWASIDSRIHVTSQFPCQGKTSMLKRLVVGSELGSSELGSSELGSSELLSCQVVELLGENSRPVSYTHLTLPTIYSV